MSIHPTEGHAKEGPSGAPFASLCLPLPRAGGDVGGDAQEQLAYPRSLSPTATFSCSQQIITAVKQGGRELFAFLLYCKYSAYQAVTLEIIKPKGRCFVHLKPGLPRWYHPPGCGCFALVARVNFTAALRAPVWFPKSFCILRSLGLAQ